MSGWIKGLQSSFREALSLGMMFVPAGLSYVMAAYWYE